VFFCIQPLEAIQWRARQDRTSVSWFLNDFNLPRAGNVVRFKSAALVFINSDSGEQYITVDGNSGDRYDYYPLNYLNVEHKYLA
jgi:hypothetical protein